MIFSRIRFLKLKLSYYEHVLIFIIDHSYIVRVIITLVLVCNT